MSTPIITVEDLGKQYQLGKIDPRASSFREAVLGTLAAPFRRLRQLSGEDDANSFWALRHVSFEIGQGEIVGLIGRNGAGKSTMLKLFSRVTEPTEGRAKLRGRVGALLEVGTGFHQELTGRENIFLNGAILGMKRSEILEKFDKIVAFSQIEQFLDTPVKRYSSGMYVRLAFAVAAHLEPEILIIDEVLAVGDAEFQRKCLGRMDELRTQSGRTILVVSHNLEMIESLCTRCILLDHGQVVFDGKTREALDKYRSLGGRSGEIAVTTTAALTWVGLQNAASLRGLRADEDIVLELAFKSGGRKVEGLQIDVELVDSGGRRAAQVKSRFVTTGYHLEPQQPAVFKFTLRSPKLAPGEYFLTVHAQDIEGVVCWVERIAACEISARSYFPAVDYIDEITGATVPSFEVEMLT